MTVQDLFEIFQALPESDRKKMEVLFNSTPPDSEMFHFKSVDNAEQVFIPEGDEEMTKDNGRPVMLLECGLDTRITGFSDN
jgi:hypothetical protein